MLRHAISLGLVCQNFTIAMTQIIVLGLIALPLAGCGADGQGGPIISPLSTPTDAQSGDGAPSDSHTSATGSPVGEDPTIAMLETSPDPTANDADDLVSGADLADPGEGQEDPGISMTSTPTGATARLTWDASADHNVEGYFIHYGKQSTGEPGSCSYQESQRVGHPPATITGLEPNTVYFFAISAFGESESESDSPCSNEVLVVTPSVQS